MDTATPLWEEVSSSVLALLKAASRELMAQRDLEYPNECVGVVTRNGIVWPLINQARSPRRFEVSQVLVAEAIAELRKHGEEPVAVYHSHPEGSSGPSGRDASMMQALPGSVHIIIGIDGISAWMWQDELRSVTRIPLPRKVKGLYVEPA